MNLILDCALLGSMESFHTALALGLNFPKWYGKNLDALYDCLTDLEEAEIKLLHFSSLEEKLGDYGPKLRRTLEEAAEENPRLQILFEE